MSNGKTLCVMGLFDDETNRKIDAIKSKIDESGCASDGREAHITFGIYSDVGRDEMKDWVQSILADLKRIPLFFGQVGIFPESEVFFAAPSVTQELLDMHAKIHEKYDTFCNDKNCLYSLHAGKWVPHVTLSFSGACESQHVLPLILEGFVPFSGELVRLKITEQEPLGEVAVFDLPA